MVELRAELRFYVADAPVVNSFLRSPLVDPLRVTIPDLGDPVSVDDGPVHCDRWLGYGFLLKVANRRNPPKIVQERRVNARRVAFVLGTPCLAGFARVGLQARREVALPRRAQEVVGGEGLGLQ